MKLLVTGNCGFIGQNFVRMFKDTNEIIGLDCLGYAHDPNAINLCKTIECDICDILNSNIPTDFDAVIHFSAESHVDNSIISPYPFVHSNINGTFQLLEFVRKNNIPKIIHISTDEVYGDLELNDPPFSNLYQMRPSSPYSASKASADMLVLAYNRTYNMNIIIVRPCNNYGPFQYKEKFIPVIIRNALKNNKIPLYGNGMNIREWMYVEDNCNGIMKALQYGESGDIFNLGSGIEITNKDLIYKILKIMGKPNNLIEFVNDRKGHDKRYSLDSSNSYKKLNWKPEITIEKGLNKTIKWFEENYNYWSNS